VDFVLAHNSSGATIVANVGKNVFSRKAFPLYFLVEKSYFVMRYEDFLSCALAFDQIPKSIGD